MNNTTAELTHPFQRAGLGLAPFKFVGMIQQDIAYGQAIIGRGTNLEIMTKPGGTCDYCGNYIVNMYRIKSADGRVFKVGSDCAEKTGDARIVTAVRKAINAARKASLANRAADARAFVTSPVVQAFLSARPHPQAFRAADGATLADYYAFTLKCAGNATYVKRAKQIRDMMNE